MCSVSIFDMEKFLRALDAEVNIFDLPRLNFSLQNPVTGFSFFLQIEANLLHTGYMGKGWMVCNDCRDTTRVYPGMAGQRKCCHCQSYNTCRVAPSVLPA